MIAIGEKLPDFTLPDQEGRDVTLSDLRGQPVVVYFYPADHTPGCTRQACAFRDAYEDFQDAGARVIGISPDSVERHEGFAAKHDLPFTLLADPDGEVAKRLDVPKSLGVMTGRVTYVVDGDGTVVHRFKSQLNAKKHVPEALAALQGLPADGPRVK